MVFEKACRPLKRIEDKVGALLAAGVTDCRIEQGHIVHDKEGQSLLRMPHAQQRLEPSSSRKMGPFGLQRLADKVAILAVAAG